MGKDSFLLYKSFYKPVSGLSDKQLGRLFRAVFLYHLGEVVTVEEDIEMAFNFFKNQFEIDEIKYQSKVEGNRENGRKGGISKAIRRNLANAKKCSERSERQKNVANVADNDNDNVSVISSPTIVVEDNTPTLNPKGFVPPSLDEMRRYFDEHGYSQEAAEKAFNYYTELGWVDSKGNQIKNWKLKCVSVWFDPKNKKHERPWGHQIPL